jgi:predicted nucleic acid-binding protein
MSFSVRFETEAKLVIQDMVKNNQLELAWSYILDYENEQNPFYEKKKEIQKWEVVSKDFTLENEEILKCAENLKKRGLKTFDTLHIACAVNMKCDYFITVDKGILKKKDAVVPLIQVISPVQFIEKLEEMNEVR